MVSEKRLHDYFLCGKNLPIDECRAFRGISQSVFGFAVRGGAAFGGCGILIALSGAGSEVPLISASLIAKVNVFSCVVVPCPRGAAGLSSTWDDFAGDSCSSLILSFVLMP